MKNFSIIVLAWIVCSLLNPLGIARGQEKQKESMVRSRRGPSADPELARLRADVIAKMKESRAGAEKLLALHEEERNKLSEQYKQRQELYRQGLISRAELNQIERALAMAILRIDEDKRWIAESEIAITETVMRDELLRLPNLGLGGYSETDSLVRFNGAAPWSLNNAATIEKFFLQTFGYALPITAFGQTATHDRLRFDHRNAVDVALHPDSHEGRSLISYLRRAGIPFIGFRNAVPGSATGAHIHIGKPSTRIFAVTDSQIDCCSR